MRHSRSAEFLEAFENAPQGALARRHWTDDASDPNHPQALVRRAEVLRAAWRPPITDRVAFLEDRCRDRKLLDIGCVAHDVQRMNSAQWLHARLARVAASCLGVDVLADGIEHMRSLGYDALAHDLRAGLGPIESSAPFDVIIAGELIEHVEALDMLFETAAHALAEGGEMIITTPNPYAPPLVRAARLGLVWENVDHIIYASPSGIAELCERHGLVLREAMTVESRGPRDPIGILKAIKRRLKGTQWTTVGYATFGARRIRRVSFGPFGRLIRGMTLPWHRLTGDTFVYVAGKPPRQ